MRKKRQHVCRHTTCDYGPAPFVFNPHHATEKNENFRTALWTGENLQLTLMSIPVGSDIGVERHSDTDQFIRIERGRGKVFMGESENELCEYSDLCENCAVIIPSGIWHNIVNTGRGELKLYSIYSPPHHPFGTVHCTKKDAEH